MSKLLQMKGISKAFSGNVVLKNVDFDLESGECHALLGENGAGKSTLMKILSGIYKKDAGEIYIDGKLAEIDSVPDAKNYGIGIIHQELMLMQHLTVSENIFLGREEGSNGFLDARAEIEETKKKIAAYQLDIDAETKVGALSIAQQQMVEIVKATSFGEKIIIMDEPTSSLSEREVVTLFNLIRRLKASGVGIVYISHRLNELKEISDRITVLRDGESVATVETAKADRDELVNLMVGRQLSSYYTKTSTPKDKVVLRVEHLSDGKLAKDVSFDLREGEILGFSGLVGAGRSESMNCLFGITRRVAGKVWYEDKEVSFRNPGEAMKHGFALVPEDRKFQGLFLKQGARMNSTITVLDKFLGKLSYSKKKENEITDALIEELQIKLVSREQITGTLSGGNQQKVLIGRWLQSCQKVLILDEPTRGVDVKTKAEIYALIDKLAKSGLSIIMISSEMPELISMCDRVVVLFEGKTTGVLERGELSQEKIMSLSI